MIEVVTLIQIRCVVGRKLLQVDSLPTEPSRFIGFPIN